ncbi:MAG: hypothetical protein IKO36_08410 [Bacteroidaceae bacterium]|nr:hypothetical protein [Bacteroidaceae bacterium]
MFFRWNGKNYTVEVEKVFSQATREDYRPDLTENGVVIKEFEDIEDFEDCNVCLFYNPTEQQVTIHLEKEEYVIITDVHIGSKELDIIINELSD